MAAPTIAIDARKVDDFGIGTYLRGLIGALARLDREHRYLLLAGPEGPDVLPHLPGNFRWIEERAPGYSVRELFAFAAPLRREQVDLFHAPHYVLPFALPCPAVVTIHDLIHLRFPELRSRLELGYARFMIARSLRRAARVIAVSSSTAADLVGEFGTPSERIAVVPNGVDEEFRRDRGEGEVRATLDRLGLEPGYLLFVGNPKPHKNLGRLLAALALLRSGGTTIPPLVLAGDRAGSRSPVPEMIRAAGVQSAVVSLGHLAAADLPALYRGAVMLVQPSLWEGFGLPVAEAMAVGTPVVAARRGALPEVAEDSALLVDPESVPEIAAAIASLLGDPAQRSELARRGRERAARFRWDEAARATLAVYRAVLAAHHGDREPA